jgi:uncharacterized protein (DUF427 family)
MRARPTPDRPGPGQESVWDYPRPPALQVSSASVVVRFGGRVIATSSTSWRVLETSHPPVHYLPRGDVDADVLVPTPHVTFCEFKGIARYADLVVGDRRSAAACWWYPDPAPGFEPLADAIAFYPQRVDEILLDGEQVRPVPGDFYGGWVTSRVTGPFKGGPGTVGW